MTARDPTIVLKLPLVQDEDLTAEEFGRRHHEALANPRHELHSYASQMFQRACIIDTVNQGIDPTATLGPNGEAPNYRPNSALGGGK